LLVYRQINKLINRGRIAIFIGYSKSIDKHYRIYALDLGHTVFLSVVVFNKKKKEGKVDLKIKMLKAKP
jgi:hypothetical protein